MISRSLQPIEMGYIPISMTQIIYMKMLSDSTKQAPLGRNDSKTITRKEMPAL